MDCTPTQEHRVPRRVPTPKLSERKKKLFWERQTNVPQVIPEDSDLGPISPLQFSNSSSPRDFQRITSFRNILGHTSPCSEKSLSPDFESRFSRTDLYEVLPMDDGESRLSFSSNQPIIAHATKKDMALILDDSNSSSFSNLTLENQENRKQEALKTPGDRGNDTKMPKLSSKKSVLQEIGQITPSTDSKINKNDENSDKKGAKARTSLSFGSISTKSFYSSAVTQPTTFAAKPTKIMEKLHHSPKKMKFRPKKLIYKGPRLGVKGVSHKIRPVKKKCIRNMTSVELMQMANEIIDKSALNDYLQQKKEKETVESMNVSKYENDEELKKQINRLKKIFKETKNPIEMARPLSLSKSMTELYNHSASDDSEEDEREDLEQTTIDLDDQESEIFENDSKTRKFFKTGSNKKVKKEFKLVHNMSATMNSGGKVMLNRAKPKKRKLKSLFDDDFEFEDENREVDGIIKKLDQFTSANTNADTISTNTEVPSTVPDIEKLEDEVDLDNLDLEEIVSKTAKVHGEIRELELLLQAVEAQKRTRLTTVGTFPETPPDDDNHMLVECQNNEDDDEIIIPDSQMEPQSQEVGSKLFPIFYKDKRLSDAPEVSLQDPSTPLEAIFENARKRFKTASSWKPIGENQYQIDAGQKNFGARQCDECGFLYSTHEPEDEKLHQQYHESKTIIKYTRWKEEIEVCLVPEWGVNGRIVAYKLNLDQPKLDRLDEVLAIVNHEMGYYDRTILPDSALIYLAVLKNTIIGICLAHPLDFAYRLMSIETADGVVDYFSTEQFPVKCGISRIWVTPFSRRMGVARKLISAVKSHFIFAHYMSYDEIAFSSPTESGKVLAESLTKRKDFLVYY